MFTDGSYFVPYFQRERAIPTGIDSEQGYGWEEVYLQNARNYFRLPPGSTSARHPGCYLVDEPSIERYGPDNSPVIQFTRIFMPIPSPRTEKRLISFTLPGQSAVQTSLISGKPIGWNEYGKASPKTDPVLADVQFSYGVNEGNFILPTTTQIRYAGAPVDYVGQVFVNSGTEQVAYKGNLISEARFTLAGSTTPPSMPTIWTLEPLISRWRGVIWEMQVVTVNTFLLFN